MSEWYYMSGGQQHGPVSAGQLKSLASAGTLVPEDLVWNQSMPEWVPARRVRGLPFAGGAAAKSPAPVRAAGRAVAASAPARPAAAEPEHPPEAFESEQTATAVASEASAAEERFPAHSAKGGEDAAKPAVSHANSHRGSQGVPTHAVELFARTRSAVSLISFLTFLLMLVALALTAFTALLKYDKSGKILTPAVLKYGFALKFGLDMPHMVVYGVYTLIGFIMLVLLGGYSSRIKKVTATYGSEELENAMRAQSRLWKFMLLALLATIAVVVLRQLHYVFGKI